MDMRAIRFGIEIETIKRTREQTAAAIHSVVGGTIRAWYGRENTTPQHYDSTRYATLNLHNLWYRNTVEMRAANSTLHAGKVKAYIQFVLALAAKAISARAASSRKREFNPESAKYNLRVLLLRFGMIGDEFKTARMHLMANMPGDAAFKTREKRIKHTAKRNAHAKACGNRCRRLCGKDQTPQGISGGLVWKRYFTGIG